MEKKKCVNKHLFALDFKSNILSLILFSLIVGGLMFGVLALFPSLNEIISSVPDDIKEYLSFDSITTYFSAESMSLWILIGGIYAIWLGAKLSNGDFKNGNAELLYSLNMSRNQIVFTKSLVMFLHITIYNIVVAIFSFAGVWIFGGKAYVLGMLCYLLLAWVLCLIVAFLAFGWGLIAKGKFAPIIGWVIIVVLYVLASVSGVVSWLGYVSPFTALNGDILAHGFSAVGMYWISLLVWGVVAVVHLLSSTASFKKADLN